MLAFQRILYAVIFIALFLICLINIQPVDFNLYFAKFSSPLIVLLFIAFVVGIFGGVLAVLPKLYRQSRKIKELKEETKDLTAAVKSEEAKSHIDVELEKAKI